ncbi:COR domain-containing protein [Chitinophaga sp. Hz27]|uniref:COR domain-containing protein n=1 Tax=Chitinophaga sp. Hz27 TaxID=3347169 RepID=UPI0035E206BE
MANPQDSIIRAIRKRVKEQFRNDPSLLEKMPRHHYLDSRRRDSFTQLKHLHHFRTGNGYGMEKGEVVSVVLRGCGFTTIPAELKQLKNLRSLDLAGNQLEDLSELILFTNLEDLNLSGNRCTDISCLGQLSKLQELGLSNNYIENITPLSSLTNLNYLSLESNQIADISVLVSLHKLQSLRIAANPIVDIAVVNYLKELRYLYASNLSLRNLPVLDLPRLVHLYLSKNELDSIAALKELKSLAELDLSYNNIKEISVLREMHFLQTVNLNDNQISKLPRWLFDWDLPLRKRLEYIPNGICIDNNPIQNIPVELISIGKEAIRDYFKSLDNGAQPLNEVKVILLGEGASGKTSLLNYLIGKQHNAQEAQTHGINIDISKLPNDVLVKIWDFGGQDIMHHTHQFFLTERSVYVLVLNARENTDTEKWLKLIQVFGGNSPVIIVTNKIDENPSSHENIKHLTGKYPNINGRYLQISCQTGKNLPEFKQMLVDTIEELSYVKTMWGNNWLGVKSELEKMRNGDELKDYIHFEAYREICNQQGVADTHQGTLINWLHHLGAVTYFPDAGLNETNVINPSWLTGAFYAIINSAEIANNYGRFSLCQLDRILDKERYPIWKYNFLVSLMLKFELCYKIDDNNFLIPDLLSKEQPDFKFDFKNALKFKVKYNAFLPKSIFPKMVVKRHEEIKNDLKWRTGMVIEDKNYEAKAVVIVDEEEKELSIAVAGVEKRGYLASIVTHLESINALYRGIDYDMLVPCLCQECMKATIPYYHKYVVLQKARTNNRAHVMCEQSIKDVSVSELLGVLITKAELTRELSRFVGVASHQLKMDLEMGNVDGFIETVKRLFSSVSYFLFEKSEKAYHTPLFIVLRSILGKEVRSDEMQAGGRADIVINTDKFIYILELKLNSSASRAIEQIRTNKYYQPYLDEKKPIVLVGINFISTERNIGDYEYAIMDVAKH